MSEEPILPIPNLKIPEWNFHLASPKLEHLHETARAELLKAIEVDEMAPYYKLISSGSSPVLPLDDELLKKMEEANEKKLKEFKEKLVEAEKTEGDTEVSDILRAKAMYLTKIGDKEKAIPALNTALEKTPGLGSRIDLVLTLTRLGFFYSSPSDINKHLTQAAELIDKGGDWDRRNRLKVYQALYRMSIRDFKKAGELFCDILSTFTATELIDYDTAVLYAVISNILTLRRVDLKKKIIDAPEVIQLFSAVPALSTYTKSLYSCHYATFFTSLSTIETTFLAPSLLLSPHSRYYTREMRILAYNQLLQSYSSLTLESLASAFGVSEEFIDKELARFISSTRLHARIDRVNRVVETTRPELKSGQYDKVIKQGDLLLNNVQRLSKVLY
ncbi:PCI-domain-containing protein [Sistotremastrum niveocremeum HHB9708]|uniref:PCI-domain-containing protein n=2 Tax=Sistotremastraceae TaxID=3402574 RepID=A0A164MEL8_9AGAM|nr:PCI-domain-containing protein [Sistotremastrum niveocremeum HHB9708]KZT34621.1 PCI-domain-containing protein [Sistotremastrum suecicum HHB10207 ss-3]